MTATPEKVYKEFRVTRNLIWDKWSQGVMSEEERNKMLRALYKVCYEAIGVRVFDNMIDAERITYGK